MRVKTSFIFDLDGTLVDSVYQNVMAWKAAFDAEGIPLAMWRIHRKIGMSGGLFLEQIYREIGVRIEADQANRLHAKHAESYEKLQAQISPLAGAHELLESLTSLGLSWAIATSGKIRTAQMNLDALGFDINKVNLITRDDVKYAKPDPDLFIAAAQKMNVAIENCVVVGDAVWDMLAARRCRALGVGLLSGGYDVGELERSGALRVYEDPADLLAHLDEVTSRP